MKSLDSTLSEGIKPFEVSDDIMMQWQELVNAMAELMDVPAGLIMRLNEKRIEVFTTSHTENNPYHPKDSEFFFDSGLYCETVIRTNERLYVRDALKDPHWKKNPDVALNMISYLGFPIRQADNTPFGTLCILDNHEREYTKEQEHLLIQFRNMIESHLKLVTTTNSLAQAHEEIQKSISYASKIQKSLLADTKLLDEFFKDSFIIWEPKDIVGGDIYFVRQLNEDELFIIFVDCTGHGIAGAMVTMIVKAIEQQLTSILKHKNHQLNPAKMLSGFNKEMKHIFEDKDDSKLDFAGFDGAVVVVNKSKKELIYSGAKIPLFLINKKNELESIEADKCSVGYKSSNENYEFRNHIINLEDFSSFYLSTDGFVDQVGGKKDFSFGIKRLKSALQENCQKSFAEQKNILINTLKTYQGDNEQVDDNTVLGFKV